MARNFNELRDKMSPERRARVDARVKEALAAMPLDELREARELTQNQLAQTLNVSQGAISKVERRADMYISTLRSYVRAIGGDLQIRAVFPEGEVLINQFKDLDPTNPKSADEEQAAATS
jgi:transcriptional regulator with XRE-family HTH domain